MKYLSGTTFAIFWNPTYNQIHLLETQLDLRYFLFWLLSEQLKASQKMLCVQT